MPPPIAWTVPAGVKNVSPGLGDTQLRSCSISPETAASRSRSRVIVSRRPRPILASGFALTMYHISDLPSD